MFEIDQWIVDYPVCQYKIVGSEEVVFSERVRHICKTECERYGKSWSCPPAVGDVEECKKRCRKYRYAFVFTTMAEVTDASILSETLSTRAQHEQVTREICENLRKRGADCLPLSVESCQICEKCAYPDPCRFPGKAIPCVESYGILVTELAKICGIDFYYDNQTVTWFGLIFFDENRMF